MALSRSAALSISIALAAIVLAAAYLFVTRTDGQASTMDVTGCAPNPRSTDISMGGSVTFVNRDAKPHIISFGPGTAFVVDGNSRSQQAFGSWKYPGVRYFNCDASERVGSVTATDPARNNR